MSRLVLRELNAADEAAFLEGYRAFVGESPHWFAFNWDPGVQFSDHLARLAAEKRGINLEPGRVAHTMLYGFVDGKLVGRLSVRHELNDYLRRRGGHVGYAVAPPFRRRGYATQMFLQGLEYCRRLGLQKIMLTCDDDNLASWKLIENHGGVLAEKFFDEEDDAMARRYWVDL